MASDFLSRKNLILTAGGGAARASLRGAASVNLNLKMKISGPANANTHSSMVKRSSIFEINILAVLPLASNASSAVLAAIIVPAIMARTAS